MKKQLSSMKTIDNKVNENKDVEEKVRIKIVEEENESNINNIEKINQTNNSIEENKNLEYSSFDTKDQEENEKGNQHHVQKIFEKRKVDNIELNDQIKSKNKSVCKEDQAQESLPRVKKDLTNEGVSLTIKPNEFEDIINKSHNQSNNEKILPCKVKEIEKEFKDQIRGPEKIRNSVKLMKAPLGNNDTINDLTNKFYHLMKYFNLLEKKFDTLSNQKLPFLKRINSPGPSKVTQYNVPLTNPLLIPNLPNKVDGLSEEELVYRETLNDLRKLKVNHKDLDKLSYHNIKSIIKSSSNVGLGLSYNILFKV